MTSMPESAARSRASGRLLATALIAAIGGTALSFWGWRAARHSEQAEMEAVFKADSAGLQESVSREIAAFMDVLDSIRHLSTLSTHISDADFREFVAKGMVHQRRVLGTFGFTQLIADGERATYERGGTVIVERGPAGGFQPAGRRVVYFPISYQATNEISLGLPAGFDLASGAGEQRAVEQMLWTGSIVLGDRGAGPDGDGYLAFAPVLDVVPGPQPLLRPRGFAFALFRPHTILEPVHRLAETRGLKVQLIDAAPSAAGDTEKDHLAMQSEMPFAGVVWTFRCYAAPEFIARHRTGQPALLLGAGLFITLLLAAQLALLARRAASVEQQVRDRTAALREANARLGDEMAERARLQHEILGISTREKERVGRDLHDSLGQKLTGAVYLSRALADQLTERPDARQNAERINAVLKDAVSQSRRIARGLAPMELAEAGLADALRRLAEDTTALYGVSCSFSGEGHAGRLRGAEAEQLYHIAQEAVTNAAKHSGATEISIVLESTPDGGEMVVEDNGRGLPEDARKGSGMGLRIMKHRADLIGGTLVIGPAKPAGTSVVCRFPAA